MPQFDISTFGAQLFWLTVSFSFLYLLISKFIAPKAEEILTSRHSVIDDHVTMAEEFNKKSAHLQALKEQGLDQANQLAEDIRQQAVDNLNHTLAKKKQEVQDEIKLKTDRALRELGDFANNFHAQETESCVQLAAAIIAKITGKAADINLLNKIEARSK